MIADCLPRTLRRRCYVIQASVITMTLRKGQTRIPYTMHPVKNFWYSGGNIDWFLSADVFRFSKWYTHNCSWIWSEYCNVGSL